MNRMVCKIAQFMYGRKNLLGTFASVIVSSFFITLALADDFTATSLGDYGNVTVMEVTGNYNAENAENIFNNGPRAVIAKEFFRTHKDEYDFLVIFTNFDFQMPEREDRAFYMPVKNDVQGIGAPISNTSSYYGSEGRLQGMIDMGNIEKNITDPLDKKFEETLSTLSHEIMHRWAAYAEYQDENGAISSALLGRNGAHWSFLLDSGGSVLLGNQWRDNGNGTFTSTTPQSEMKYYSPLDLYLMGMIDKSKVPPMLLINSPSTDIMQLPQAGVTVSGTARSVTIDQIIAAMGPRIPDAAISQKNFKSAFIYITPPGMFTGDGLSGIENVRNGIITHFSILTDGAAILQVASTPQETFPTNPGVVPTTSTPRTLPPNISDGAAWLMKNQRTDGSWADLSRTAGRDTAEAILILSNFFEAQSNYQSALQWTKGTSSRNMDFLARKIEALAGAGQDTTALVNEVIARQNADGGWGSDKNYASNAEDSGLTLKALAVAGYPDQGGIAKAIAYLKTTQNADGSWGNEDKGGMVRETSNTLSAINNYRTVFPIEDAVSRGTAWLVARQNFDGGYGPSTSSGQAGQSTVYDTAVAAMTLIELNASTDITNKAINYIQGRQSDNGSWNESSYQTALAVRAIYKATVDPDLSIKPEDITFIPASVTGLPANIVISANVRNQGRAAVAQATVALYDGDPSTGPGQVGEQVLSFAGQSSTIVAFSVPLRKNAGQFYTVVIDPDNLVKESNKLNNTAARAVPFDATYDFQVTPSDISVSANPVELFQDLKITAKITNNGTMDAYNAQVKYSIDDFVSPLEIATQTVDIPAGATITNTTTWRVNRSGADLPLTVTVDPFNTFTELSKANNKATVPITVNADTRPNLTVSYKDILIYPSPANRGGSATISVLVKNEGFSSASAIAVNYYVGVPGKDGVLIGSQTIPDLASGASATVSFNWRNIPVQGERIIYVQVDPAGLISEITRADNDAFTTLVIRDLPDLVISQNSIAITPAAPKEGDVVRIATTVQNTGAQTASNVAVQFAESGAVISASTISAIAPGATAVASMTYDTTGKKGSHSITVTIDPDNAIAEQTKDNNIATRTFGVQDSNLWLTEQYISPNGDGVKDSTQIFFRLDAPATVTVGVVNARSETVRTFKGPELVNISSGNITWDGLNDDGMVVPDGVYQIQVRDAKSSVLGSLAVVVDTDRSPISEAFGTNYFLNNDLSCMLPDISEWKWFPDESGIVFFSWGNGDYPYGFYTMSPDGQDVKRVVPLDWVYGNVNWNTPLYRQPDVFYWSYSYEPSPNSDKIAFLRQKYLNHVQGYYYNWGLDVSELWISDRDGNTLFSMEPDETTQVSGFKWSPRGDYLIYGKNGALWIARSDGTGKRIIDSDGPIDVNRVRWAADDGKIAYVMGATDAAGNYTETIRIADLNGNKQDVYSGKTIVLLEWLASQKMVMQDADNIIRIVDASGQGNHLNVYQATGDLAVTIGPNKSSFIFVDSSNRWGCSETAWNKTYWCDTDGNAVPLHIFEPGAGCYMWLTPVRWSPDGKEIFFTEHSYDDECSLPCANDFGSRTVIIDVQTKKESSPSSAGEPFEWLPDGISLAYAYDYETWDQNQNTNIVNENLCTLNSKTGESKCGALQRFIGYYYHEYGFDISPQQRYITHVLETDPSSVCRSYSIENLWAISSLLNLTADLRAVPNRSAVILKGNAADLNFAGYQLDYADVKNPTTWLPVAPPSDVPVVNDTFTTWVPPYEGSFYVRLKVWDKAGNIAESRKRVSWGLASSITNLYKTTDIFSPNGDGVKDIVELHYRVLEPVHLEFDVYDETNALIRTYYKDYTSPGEDFVSWDGADQAGHVAPDGQYSIKVFDYEFFIKVDSTLPDAKISVSPISLNKSGMPVVSVLGHAFDTNIKSWSIEFGQGENPQVWMSYQQGSASLALRDSNGAFLSPPQDVTVQSFAEDLGFLRGKKARITAQDLGGNLVTSVSALIDDRIFLVSDTLYQQGNHKLKRAVTTPYPISELYLQAKTGQQWTDVASLQDPDASISEFSVGNIHYASDPSGLRLKGVDVYGREYVSNDISTNQTFSVSADCGSGTVAVSLLEDLTSLKLQVKGTNSRQWTDIAIYSGSELTSLLSRGTFSFPSTASLVRSVALGESGRLYTSAPAVPTCGQGHGIGGHNGSDSGGGYSGLFAPILTVSYGQDDCDHPVSGTATLSASSGIQNYALRSLRYYLDTAQDTMLLKTIDLTTSQSTEASVDIPSIPDGRYPVRAVWEYYDASYDMLQETSAFSEIIVDHTPPTARLTYPAGNSLKLCPIQTHNNTGDRYTIPVEADISDSSGVERYELYFGHGDNPDKWYPAVGTTDLPISGNRGVAGTIGPWNISKLPAGAYTLRLKAVDAAGNVGCSTATFSYDTPVEISKLAIDHKLISPNSAATMGAVAATFEIDKFAVVDAHAYKLVQTANGYSLDTTPVAELVSGLYDFGGIASVEWNGTDGSGAAASDGPYGVAVHAVDGCENTSQKWVAVEVDGTPPVVSITYPKSGDLLGNIVEVKGSANDMHFEKYILEAGQGDNPSAWIPVTKSLRPITDSVLGSWNIFGLSGQWTLRLTASDTVGNKNETKSLIDLSARQNLIKSLGLAPTLFSPNTDGKLDTTTIQYELTDTCDVMIEIVDGNGVARRTFASSAVSAGSHQQAFDGNDDAGAVIPDGAYSVRLTAVQAGMTDIKQVEAITAIIDATPPAVNISRPLNNSYVRNDITVTGSIVDLNLSEYTVTLTGPEGETQIDQGSQTRTDYAFGIMNDLPDGAYALNIKTKDLGENITEKNIAFTVDKTAPVVTIDVSKNSGYYGGEHSVVDITGGVVEQNFGSFILRYGPGEAPLQWTELVSGDALPAVQPMFSLRVGPHDGVADGIYTLSLLVTDKAGSSAEAMAKITVDNTAPSVTFTSPGDGAVISKATDIKGTALDQNLDSYVVDFSAGQCADAYQWAAIKTSSTSVQNGLLTTWQALPPDGDYCLRLTAVDKSGNTAQAAVSVKVATHPPAPPILSGTIVSKTDANLTWTGDISTGLAGYNVYRNGRKINNSPVPGFVFRDRNLTEGKYSYTVTALDADGLESKSSNEVDLAIDLTGPAARISSPQDGSRVSGLIDIKGSAYSADDFRQYRVSIGLGDAPSSWTLIRTSPVPVSYGLLVEWDTVGLAEGQVWSIKLEAEDLSGNITTNQISVTVDNMPPAAPLLLSAGAAASDVTVNWRANTETDLAGYLLYRNDQLVNVTSGMAIGDMKPYLIAGTTYLDKSLPDGVFTYYLNAMDMAGNISGQSNALEVTIDTHPPHALIVDPSDAARFSGKIMIKAASSDLDIASVRFQYQAARDTTWTDLGSPIANATLATNLDPAALGLAYGDYRLRAVATDKGNKTDPAPGFITFSYTDLTPPAAATGLNTLVSGSTVTLTWAANTELDLAGYNIYKDGQKINAAIIASAEFQEQYLEDGTYSYTVTAVDTHQNESRQSSPASAKIYAPVIRQPYTPTGQTAIQLQGENAGGGAAVEIFAEGVAGYESRGTIVADAAGKFMVDNYSLTSGENRIIARAKDSAGNVSRDADTIVVVSNETPSAPAGLVATAQNSDVHLAWDPNLETDILGYNVYRDGVKVNASDAVDVSQAMAYASSSFSWWSTRPDNAIDSSIETYWAPQANTNVADPAWWEMDFADPQLISRVELHWGTDLDASGNEILYAGKDFEIQAWSGYAWITQAAVAGNTVKDNVFDFKTSYRTYSIRIYITDSTDSSSAKQIRLAEVNVVKDNPVTPPAFDDLNLKNNRYTYAVTAVDNYGFESAMSSGATVTVAIAPPGQPAVLTVEVVQTGLNATWVYAGSPEAGFNLYRSRTTGGPYTKINNSLITENAFLDKNVLIGVTQYYVVTVEDSAGNEGAYSNEASGTPTASIAPDRPSLFFPTTAGTPITVFSNTTDIYGSADPGASVMLMDNGTSIGTTPALSDDRVRKIPLDGDIYGSAALSPDGTMVAYTKNDAIWFKSLITGVETHTLAQCYGIVWSPDSGKIVYSDNNDGTGNTRINVYDIASGAGTPVTGDANGYVDYPSWYPDGRKVLFTRWGAASSGIYAKDLVSGEVKLIVSADAPANPQLSPDGKQLSYFDNQNLYLFDLSTHTGQVVDANTDGSSNGWSPDGKKLAFVSYRNGSGDLFLLNISDGMQTPVPGSNGSVNYVSWMPDSSRILFSIWNNDIWDHVWMSDVHTLSQPVWIMPDQLAGRFIGRLKTGTIAFVDGTFVYLLDLKGTFSFNNVQLAQGENLFTATATDDAGNSSVPSDPLSVTYDTSMRPDLTLSADDVYLYPPCPIAGEQMSVNAVISNIGRAAASNVKVSVYVRNALGQSELLSTETISSVPSGSSALITTTWDSSGKTGNNRLIVVVDPENTILESDESNNMEIRDFFAADHAGVSMTTALDNAQYTSNRNANISAMIRNAGPTADAVLKVQIEDANGMPIATFDPKTLHIAYATGTNQTYLWNTGTTYAGAYVVHAVLRDVSGNTLADNKTSFAIVSDAAIELIAATDKIAYNPMENVAMSFTIRNIGKNYIIPTVQATVSFTDAAGSVMFSDVKKVSNLAPGTSIDLGSSWNTGSMPPGNYRASVAVSYDGGPTMIQSVSFRINTVITMTGTIAVNPSIVPVGNAAQLTYRLINTGNADAPGYTAKLTVIDPETQTITETYEEPVDIAQNTGASGQITVNTNGYGIKTYTAILQAVHQGEARNIASSSFTVKDMTPPIVSIITPTPNSIHDSAMAIAVLATDNATGVDRVEYQLDNGLWKSLSTVDPAQGKYGTTWDPVPADNGVHLIAFRATDKAGNVSSPVSEGVTILMRTDTTPPTGSIMINNGAAYTNNATVTLALGCADSESGCSLMQFANENETWSAQETYGSTRTWQLAIGDGPHTVSVRYADAAGNLSTASSATITLDTTPPMAIISGTPASPTNSTGARLTIGGADVVSYKYKLNSGNYSSEMDPSLPIVLTGLTGTQQMFALGKDLAGNWQKEQNATIATWQVDTISPVLTLSMLADGAYTNNEILNISGRATDDISLKGVTVNGTAQMIDSGGNFSEALRLITGANTITTIAADAAGNTSADVRTINLDQWVPAIAITQPHDNSTTNISTASVEGSVDRPANISIRVNGAHPAPDLASSATFSFPITYAYGTNTIEVIATDPNLAVNTSTAKRSVIFDDMSPALAVINPAQDTATNQPGILLRGTVSDLTNIVVAIACNGNTFTPAVIAGTFEQQLLFTDEKTYAVVVTATDAAGNASTVRRNILYDATPPALSIDPVKTPTNIKQQTVTGTREMNSAVTVTGDAAAAGMVSYPTETTWQVVITGMAEGTNLISATATDQVGNVSKPVSAAIVLDTHAPVTAPSPAGGTYASAVLVTLTTNEPAVIYYTIDGTTPTTASNIYTASIGVSTSTTIKFFAIDTAGNREAVKSAVYTITINTPLSITTTTLPSGSTGASYSQTLTATGGTKPYVWSLSAGSLPCGLSLSSSTGAITGQPKNAGTYSFTVRVKDAKNATNAKSFSITITAPLTISTSSLASGIVGNSYCQTLAATGGKSPYAWTVSTGSLPDGLSLAGSTGKISGTPLSAGTSTFIVQVKDAANNAAAKTLSISISAPLTISTSSLPAAAKGIAYNQTLTASGGMTPYSWSITSGSLPAGLTLNKSTGTISGKATTKGKSCFTVKVTDANAKATSKSFSITVN